MLASVIVAPPIVPPTAGSQPTSAAEPTSTPATHAPGPPGLPDAPTNPITEARPRSPISSHWMVSRTAFGTSWRAGTAGAGDTSLSTLVWTCRSPVPSAPGISAARSQSVVPDGDLPPLRGGMSGRRMRVFPQSTGTTCPVMDAERSLASITATSAQSSTVVYRPSGDSLM